MPAPAADLARRRHAELQRLGRLAADAAAQAWKAVDPARIVESWAAVTAQPLAAVTAAQLAAAAEADAYTSAALAAQGLADTPAGAVVASRLAGIASDGRTLAGLLQQPAIGVLQDIGAGVPVPRALAGGGAALDMIVRTQVADAGRAATGVAVTARGVGYVRQLSTPSCARCVILAGKFYRWNTGFQRHPRCDCIHVPTTQGRSTALRTDPRGYFSSLTAAEQDRAFTRAGAEAIRDGADLGQVVNARRGMTAAGTTTESTSRRGVAQRGRLMPEEIYRRADGDRTEALRLLELHGYLVVR